MQNIRKNKKGSRLLRKGRVSWAGPNYFISSFIADGAGTIDNQTCFQILLEELNQLEQQGVLYCPALVVMPDHIHMIIRLGPQVQLGRAMKKFKGRTARRINQSKGTVGSIWYEGFHDHLIRPDEPLINFTNYILMNPVKKRLAQNPAGWPFLMIKPELKKPCS